MSSPFDNSFSCSAEADPVPYLPVCFNSLADFAFVPADCNGADVSENSS
jgi:hypothetical protein